ncbi:hypothetical protein O6H91_06G067500 [Diphasiastrum complanatum]|nr:hypothetical protein O6H91_06G067500 [Diphasiastrum complanatum]
MPSHRHRMSSWIRHLSHRVLLETQLVLKRFKRRRNPKNARNLTSVTRVSSLTSLKHLRSPNSYGGGLGYSFKFSRKIKSLLKDKILKLVNTTSFEIVLKGYDHRVWGDDIISVNANEVRYVYLKDLQSCSRLGTMYKTIDGKRTPTTIFLYVEQLRRCHNIFFRYSRVDGMFYAEEGINVSSA